MRRAKQLSSSLVLLALTACPAKDPAPAAAETPSAQEAEPEKAPDLPADGAPEKEAEALTPDPITHPCVVTAAAFDKELETMDRSCQSDADCVCYPGGVSEKAGCGGVTNKASAEKLYELSRQFHDDGCRHVLQCAPRPCKTKCDAGQCIEAP